MTTIKNGDVVRLHYKGFLADGSVFDSSEGRDPLEFAVGSGKVIPGLDEALPGLKVGDKKRVEIPTEMAYGATEKGRRAVMPREQFPPHLEPKVGMQFQIQSPEGRILPVQVVAVGPTGITIDANHRLAGKDLIFDIEIVEVKQA